MATKRKNSENVVSITETRLKLILSEREKHLKGEGKTLTWVEVRNLAILNKKSKKKH